MIADVVMDYLDSEGVSVDQKDLLTAGEQCIRSMNRNFGERRFLGGGRERKYPRPSSSWACTREMVYNSLGLENEGYGWRARLTFTHGDMTEAMGILVYRQALRALGESDRILSPTPAGEQLELAVVVDPADFGIAGKPFRVEGHIDMTIARNGHEEPVDWKSSARFTYQNVVAAASDPTHGWWKKECNGYIAQVRWYQLLLRLSGRSPAPRGYLVVVCKDTGHLAEVEIDYDEAAERDLVHRAVYANHWVEAADEERTRIFAERQTPQEFLGDDDSDWALTKFVNEKVPRPKFTKDMVVVRESGNTRRPDGTKGPCRELATSGKDAHPEAFRCSYCKHTARCWPDFALVPMGKPTWRTNTP